MCTPTWVHDFATLLLVPIKPFYWVQHWALNTRASYTSTATVAGTGWCVPCSVVHSAVRLNIRSQPGLKKMLLSARAEKDVIYYILYIE